MVATSLSYAPSNSSDAYFRDWGKKISDALAAGGLTKVWSNIDWASVLAPSASWQFRGHEIWAFTDALQTTAPIFVLLNYGSGGDYMYPRINALVLAEFDAGTGNPGPVLAYVEVRCSYYSTSVAANWISVGPSWLVLRAFNGDADDGKFLSVERIHASDGSDAPGVIAIGTGTGTAYHRVCTHQNGAALACNAVCVIPPSLTSGAVGAHVATYPIRAFAPDNRGELAPINNLQGYYGADLTTGNPVAITSWDGSTHTYMPTNIGAPAGITATAPSTCVLMRYE